MTPAQLTSLVEFLASLGHSIEGLAKLGVYVVADQVVIDEILVFDHPQAKAVAERLFVLSDRQGRSLGADPPSSLEG